MRGPSKSSPSRSCASAGAAIPSVTRAKRIPIQRCRSMLHLLLAFRRTSDARIQRMSYSPGERAPLPRFLGIAIFVAVALALLGGAHYYFWVRLVRDTALPPPWRAIATGALVLLGLAL